MSYTGDDIDLVISADVRFDDALRALVEYCSDQLSDGYGVRDIIAIEPNTWGYRFDYACLYRESDDHE